jgi:hypothetical protein
LLHFVRNDRFLGRTRLRRRKRTLPAPYHPCHGAQLNTCREASKRSLIRRQAPEAARASQLQADNSPPLATPRPPSSALSPSVPSAPSAFQRFAPLDNRFPEKRLLSTAEICADLPRSPTPVRSSDFSRYSAKRDLCRSVEIRVPLPPPHTPAQCHSVTVSEYPRAPLAGPPARQRGRVVRCPPRLPRPKRYGTIAPGVPAVGGQRCAQTPDVSDKHLQLQRAGQGGTL